MVFRVRLSLLVALLLASVSIFPAFAGGWAVITLDELPVNVVAGEPFTVGFTVLQHGRTPMMDLHPTITANLDKDADLVINAESDGKPGHYAATITLPKEGEWQWSIQAFTMDQPMPKLSVASASTAQVGKPVAGADAQTSSSSIMLIVRVLSLVVGLVALVFVIRRRSRLALALTVLCLAVGIVSFMAGSTVPAVEAQSKSSDESMIPSSTSQVEYGRQLFIAKGCITCHHNSKAASPSEYWTIDTGAPNLSTFSASPEALQLRLKDPTLVKADTGMPNLHLADDEIAALIAFINSK